MFKQLLPIMTFVLLLSCGQDVPLSEYEPGSKDEETLKKVFINFQNWANSRDSKRVSDLIHPDAAIMLGRERKIFSREEYIKVLPKRLSEHPPFYLGSPRMAISGDRADVKFYMTRGSTRVLITYHMWLVENKWYIHGWEY